MDNLTERLTQILNDPGSMKQIMDMAAAMGIQPEEGASLPAAPELLEQVSRTIGRVETVGKKQEALVRALLPYLRPGRQARLERAMQVLHLSHLAGAALQVNGASQAPAEEESHV